MAGQPWASPNGACSGKTEGLSWAHPLGGPEGDWRGTVRRQEGYCKEPKN